MKLGAQLDMPPTDDVHVLLRRARRADELGFDSVWLGDHLMTPMEPTRSVFDAWSVMCAVAAMTEHVQLGFSMLNPSFRPPAVLAKMAGTLDHISRGRLIFSLGAGWLRAEYEGYGLEFRTDHDERIAHEREVVQICKLLWTATGPVSFDGKYVQLRDCAFQPRPYAQPHPPIWIGGDSPATRELIREVASGWLMLLTSAEDNLAWLRSQTAWPPGITLASLMYVHVAASRAAAEEAAATVAKPSPGATLAQYLAVSALGTPEDCRARIEEVAGWGLDHLYFRFGTNEDMEVFGREILPALRATAQPAGDGAADTTGPAVSSPWP